MSNICIVYVMLYFTKHISVPLGIILVRSFFMRAILVKAKVKKTLQPVSIASYHVRTKKIVPKQQ